MVEQTPQLPTVEMLRSQMAQEERRAALVMELRVTVPMERKDLGPRRRMLVMRQETEEMMELAVMAKTVPMEEGKTKARRQAMKLAKEKTQVGMAKALVGMMEPASNRRSHRQR
tara:strand:+ start:208 stop:549 length:342 start_codon:yes stop_codon:yes gene_type:complete